jgi:hypothetical protein
MQQSTRPRIIVFDFGGARLDWNRQLEPLVRLSQDLF